MNKDKDKRTSAQIEADRDAIAKLVLKGYSQREIANRLEISQPTVSRDLQKVKEEWIKSAVSHVEQERGRLLAKLRLLQLEYWQGWENSPKDSSFLRGILDCLKEEAKFLGLYLPPALNIEEAVRAAQTAGYIVVDPTIKPKDAKQQGLTDEGADIIKSKILFGEGELLEDVDAQTQAANY